MPLDSSTYIETRERIATRGEFWAAEPRERLRMLAFALRNMPAGHLWNYTDVGTLPSWHCGSAGCAIGLAENLWGDGNGRSFGSDDRLSTFGIDKQTNHRLFIGAAGPIGKFMHEVTPSDVADAIATELAKASA